MRLFDFVAKNLNRPYYLGASGGNSIDCLTLVKEYLEEVKGLVFPVVFGGLTLANYVSSYKEDEEAAFSVLDSLLEQLGEKVANETRSSGDILSFRSPGARARAYGIDVGNGNILTVDWKIGSTVTSLKHFLIEGCYRCQQQYQ